MKRKKISEVCEIEFGTRIVKKNAAGTLYPVYGGGNETFRTDSFNRTDRVVIARFAISPKCTRLVNGKFFLNDSGLTLKTKDSTKLSQQYLDKFILSINDKIYDTARGAGQKNLDMKRFENLEILYPSLEEQEKIVARLDKANEIRDKKIKANEKLDELIKSQFIHMFGDPTENTPKYPSIKLNNLCSKIGSGATPRGGKETYKEDGISLIRSMNVHNRYFKYDDLAHLDAQQARALNNVVVEKNDVLFNITGASVTRSCVVPNEILPARVNQHVAILRCKEILNPHYLNEFLLADSIHRHLLLISKSSGATREAITKQQLEDLLIMYPPIELQNKFAQIVAHVEVQKQKNELVIAQMDSLFNSISQTTFNN